MSPVQPLDLPDSFDPVYNMPATETDKGRLHVTREAAGLARRLVENGTETDLRSAARVLEAVLECQQVNEQDPHHGNFCWMAEDSFIADLNAVEFVLAQLIPMLGDYQERLERSSPDLAARVKASIRAGLQEIARLDVHIGYTNIAVFDIHNSILGGELLENEDVRDRGVLKLSVWADFTAQRGHPLEFNSPTYTPLALRTLESLVRRTTDPGTRAVANTMASRLALSIGLRLHGPTRRLAGPHGRGYKDSLQAGSSPREERLFEVLQSGLYPGLESLLGVDRLPRRVEETASREQGLAMTTLLAPSYSLGTASAPFMSQSNTLIAYIGPDSYAPAESDSGAARSGSVFYTRYLTSDKWYEDFYHATDRRVGRNLIDEGLFYGVQDAGAVLAAYAPSSLEAVSGAKTVLVWSEMSEVSEILIGERKVSRLPVELGLEEVVAVSVGRALFAVRPLTRIGLGVGAGAFLVERDGSLVLELVQYRGPRKDFWELRWPGGFYQGKPVNAFYLETAESTEYESLCAFSRAVKKGRLSEQLDPPRTYDGMRPRVWEAEYRRDGHTVGMKIDVNAWSLLSRWTAQGEKGWPQLDARGDPQGAVIAAHGSGEELEVGGARLVFGHGSSWLYADQTSKTWYAGFVASPGTEGAVELVVPGGSVRLRSAATGSIVWHAGEVTAEAMGSDIDVVTTGVNRSATDRYGTDQ